MGLVISDLLTRYNTLLSAAGCTTDDDGVVWQTVDGDTTAKTIGGKILRLPTQEALRSPDWDKYVYFHPLCELSERGESEVVSWLKQMFLFRFNHTLDVLLTTMVELAANTKLHKKIPVRANKFLDFLPKADDTTVKNWNTLMDQIGGGPNKLLLGLYIKRGGEFQGKKCNRVAIVRYPFLSGADFSEKKLFGIKQRVADFEPFLRLYGHVLGIDTSDAKSAVETHNFASNDQIAPSLHSLLGVWFSIAEKLNEYIRSLGAFKTGLLELEFNTDWKDFMTEFAELRNLVPSMPGNEGVTSANTQEGEPTQDNSPVKRTPGGANRLLQDNIQFQQPQQVVAQPQPQVAAPPATQVQTPANNTGKQSVSDMLSKLNNRTPQQPPMVNLMQPQMAQPGMVAQPGMLTPQQQQMLLLQQQQMMLQQHQQPQQYIQPQMVAPAPVSTGGWGGVNVFNQGQQLQPQAMQPGMRSTDYVRAQQQQQQMMQQHVLNQQLQQQQWLLQQQQQQQLMQQQLGAPQYFQPGMPVAQPGIYPQSTPGIRL